jgi:hypothetical protein
MRMKTRCAAVLGGVAIAVTVFLGGSPALATSAWGVVGAPAPGAQSAPGALTREAPPSCGDHVTLKRSGSQIRVTGGDLGAFLPRGVEYAVSDTYEQNGTRHGSYNVSRQSGMSYSFTASSSSKQQFRVVISSVNQSTTYCAGNYTR